MFPMSRAPASEPVRAYTSLTIALIVTVASFVAASVAGVMPSDGALRLISTYVVFWPLNVLIYLVWTHRSYARLDPAQLRRVGRRDRRHLRSRVGRFFYSGGAANSTISAAIVSVVVMVILAQRPEVRGDPLYIGLGLLTVASSWALMAYSFAQEYLYLDADGGDGAPAVEFDFEERPRFGDYLTLAVLLSTMAATVSASIRTREAWRLVRVNVLLAFAFNSVIVAMMVSLLFGGLID